MLFLPRVSVAAGVTVAAVAELVGLVDHQDHRPIGWQQLEHGFVLGVEAPRFDNEEDEVDVGQRLRHAAVHRPVQRIGKAIPAGGKALVAACHQRESVSHSQRRGRRLRQCDARPLMRLDACAKTIVGSVGAPGLPQREKTGRANRLLHPGRPLVYSVEGAIGRPERRERRNCCQIVEQL